MEKVQKEGRMKRKNIKIIYVGADILIAGTAIINSKDYAGTIKKLR